MAVRFHELPIEVFNEEARPYIARLNNELRELFDLEGVIREPLNTKRSDNTIARRNIQQVHVTRITPDISTVVSGVSTVVGTPALTFGLSNVIGTTSSAISTNSQIALFGSTGPAALAGVSSAGSGGWAARGDHVHLFPDTIQSASGGTGSLNLTQSGTVLTLTSGATDQVTLDSKAWAINATNAAGVLQVNVVIGNTNRSGIKSVVTGGNLTGETLSMWDASMSAFSGVLDSATIYGFANTSFSATPSSGTTASKLYAAGFMGPLLNNATGQFTEIAGVYVYGPRRTIGTPSITLLSAGEIVECPTIGASQAGIYVRQRTAQVTATARYGLFIEAQNSGTARYSIYGVSDPAKFTGPLAVDGVFGATGLAGFGNTVTIAGSLDHNGAYLGLYGATLVVQSASYTVTNVTTDRTYDANSTSIDEIADVLGTLIGDLRATGIIG